MDLSFLDKTSKITPVLVNLYDSYSAYSSDETGAQDTLAETITALFANDLSPRENELVADILMALVREA